MTGLPQAAFLPDCQPFFGAPLVRFPSGLRVGGRVTRISFGPTAWAATASKAATSLKTGFAVLYLESDRFRAGRKFDTVPLRPNHRQSRSETGVERQSPATTTPALATGPRCERRHRFADIHFRPRQAPPYRCRREFRDAATVRPPPLHLVVEQNGTAGRDHA